MGKSTQPRVKGNMKPASSSRAAELGGSASPLSFDNLGGFAQFAGNTSVLHHSRPSTPSSIEETQVDLEPELTVIIKKVSKRDAVTKIKALEELEAYLKANEASLKPILPKWVTMYGKLVLEVDRRVRLAANQVHTLVTANAKKRLAPLLKELIGPWLLSMYDQSKDICKVGKGSFESVFAPDKRVGVISFCQKEILDYATDLLLYKTAETLSDARYVSKEDMVAKYARIVSSCFQIVSYLIDTLSLEERAKCQSEYNIIVDDTTMWKKFATNSNPLIRKALYSFIKTLLLQWKDMVESRLDIICPSFFPAVFTEKEPSTHTDMWDALLLMTKKFPESWIIIGKKKPSLPKLYHFLRSGLNGSPSIAYPSMLALLANLPDQMKETKFYQDVFENFWKGLSTEYIDRSNSHIFLNAYAECVVYFAITLSKTENEQSKELATQLIQTTFWDIIKVYFFNPKEGPVNEKLDPNGYAIIAKHLVVMASVENVKDSMTAFWSQMDELFVQVIIDCHSVMSRTPLDMDIFCQKTGNFLQAISGELELNEKSQCITAFTDDLAKRLLIASLGSSIVHKEHASGLLALAGQLLSGYTKAIVQAENIVQSTRQTLALVVDGPDASLAPLVSLVVSLVVRLEKKQDAKILFDAFIEQIALLGIDKASELRQAKITALLLEQIQLEKIAFDYSSSQLDQLIMKYNLDKLNDEENEIPRIIIENIISLSIILHSKGQLLSDSTVSQLLEGLKQHLVEFNHHQYVQKSDELSEPTSQSLLTTLSALTILQKIFEQDNMTDTILSSVSILSSEVFDVMFVKSLIDVQEEASARLLDDISKSSSNVWDAVVGNILVTIEDDKKVIDMIHPLFKRLRQSILDVRYTASPSDSVSRVKKLLDSIPNKEAYSLLLGDEKDWCKLSAPFHQYTDHYLALGISDTYAAISLESILDDDELMPVSYDLYGLSTYGRFTLFLGELLTNDQSARQEVMGGHYDWMMARLWMALIACEQGLLVPQLCRIWNARAVQGIDAFISNLSAIFVDWFGSLMAGIDDISTWNQQLLDAIKTGNELHDDRLIAFILRLMNVEKSLLTLGSHLLQKLFQKLIVLCDWQLADLEKWLPLLKANANELALPVKVAVLMAIKSELGEANSYIHYQSELASRLSAAKSLEQFDGEEEPTQFWSLLVLLNASALKMTGFSIPAQRLTYLIQTIRPFILESDHDFSSSHHEARVKAQFGQLLESLATSVQDVSGSHWDFFLQCCLSWVACADTTQPEELIVVYHGLSILKTLQELGLEVDEIHEVLQEHLPTLGTFLLDLMTKESKAKPAKGRCVYQTLLSDLVLHIPDTTLFSSDAFHDLDILIASPNEILQKRAYVLLQKYVANTVQDLSVRLEFTETNEEEVNAVIDETVLGRLLNPPDVSSWQNVGLEEQGLHETLGYLLSWMLMFDHFNDITFKLKQEYTAQLKDKEAISHLMPFLCKLLSIGQGQSKPFDLSPWGIDEYEILDFDATNDISYLLLASHVYYRALTLVPSLVRLWWIDCKQRQITIGVESYTEKHFSQILISNELELVNRPDVKTQLQENDENEFTVKTLKAASEVTATYRVDEQNMQIAIKLPSNFPLRQIDVEGIQKVGVNDKQWRGWMFAVAAVIGSQNGNIVDALTVFKRNVNLHFSGVEDCTICYSIISIQDRSIPTKQCRTCKNKFHSSCLYKWFKSSNSASCPLCRTVF